MVKCFKRVATLKTEGKNFLAILKKETKNLQFIFCNSQLFVTFVNANSYCSIDEKIRMIVAREHYNFGMRR